ncbi:MAG: putative ABC exporter domain-containing protein [Candidatus Baltobacteraceae bacterium]
MMDDVAALAYLQWRAAVNSFRETLRAPARLVLLLLGILYYAFFVWLRLTEQRKGLPTTEVHEPFATPIACGILLFIALPMWPGARGVLKLFASFAEARFLICSSLREEIVIPFLVLRNNLFSLVRLGLAALLYALIFGEFGGLVGMTLGLLGIFLVGSILGPFAFRVRLRLGARVAYVLLVTIATVAIVPALCVGVGALWSGAQPLAHWAIGLGFGRTLNAVLAGNPLALSALAAVFIALALASFVGARDLYPEIYNASYVGMKVLSQRGRRRGEPLTPRAASTLTKTARSYGAPRGMTGAWAIFWKDWVVFRRVSGARWLLAVGVGIGLGVGAISGYLDRSSATADVGITLFVSALSLALFMVVLMTTVMLDADIGMPLWWLSTDSLRARLYVWSVATGWRTMLPFAVGAAAYGLVSGNSALVLVALPAAAVVTIFLRSVGTALYTIFPGNGGVGPIVGMLRVVISLIALLPPALAFIFAMAFVRDPVFATFCAALVTIGESALFLEFAVARIAGNGIAIAREAA